jgi:hypothetical protein
MQGVFGQALAGKRRPMLEVSSMEEYFAPEGDELVPQPQSEGIRRIWSAGQRKCKALMSLFLIAATVMIAALLILWTMAVGSPVQPLESAAMLKRSRGIGFVPASVRPVKAIWIRPAQDMPARIDA